MNCSNGFKEISDNEFKKSINSYRKITLEEMDPFHMVIFDNFFSNEYSNKMTEGFMKMYNRGLVEKISSHGMDTNNLCKIAWYDAYSNALNPCEKLFEILHSNHFLNYIQSLFPELYFTNHIITETHHHKIGSDDGAVHNDHDTAYFSDDPLSNGINVWYHNAMYRKFSDDQVESPRTVALIYYLDDHTIDYDRKPGENSDWYKDEWGGHTGLFHEINTNDIIDSNDYLFAKIKPIPNRLVVYELGPNSWHAFRKNMKFERNTLNLFYHSTPEFLKERWPNNPVTTFEDNHYVG